MSTSDAPTAAPPARSAAKVIPAPPMSVWGSLPLLRRLVREVFCVSGGHEKALGEAGAAGFAGAWNLAAGKAVTTHRDRHVVVFETGGPGEARRFYLKRLGRAHVKHVAEALLAFEKPVSKSRREWEFAVALSRAGVAAAPILAMGERRLGGWPLESVLVVEELYGSVELDTMLEELAAPVPARARAGRAELSAALARALARMHAAGIFHQDLYAKHIFVRREGGGFVINIIDLQRMRRATGVKHAVKDLAALNVTVAWRSAGAAARMRFLREYAREAGIGGRREIRALARGIAARSERISRRSKFRGIQWRHRD